MSAPNYSGRLAGVRAQLEERGLDAMVVTNLVNVRYLCGYAGSNGVVVVTPGEATFMTDFRYVTAAEPIAAFMGVKMLAGDTAAFVARHLDEVASGARVGFEAAHVSVQAREKYDDALRSRETVPTTDVVESLRMIKDDDELELIRRSAALIEPVYQALAAEGLSGRSEQDVAWRVRELFRAGGADDLAFDTIVASHERGAMPHATPGPDVISEGTLVTIDLGCVLDGYASDCTRTFAVGEPDADLREIYAVCLEAQLAAMRAVQPGASGRDVDAVARDIISAAGHGERFGHGLGHGVGLAVHEGPRLSKLSEDTLAPGMVVTVEPGIYIPGRGGVRIEDLVIVTESGCERLTPYTKDLQHVT